MIIFLATLDHMAESFKNSAAKRNFAVDFKGIDSRGSGGKDFSSPALKHRDKIRRDAKKFHP